VIFDEIADFGRLEAETEELQREIDGEEGATLGDKDDKIQQARMETIYVSS
jgi:hypothetical protein